ncbi:MAG TPA: PilN domain-containing protein [Holophagaceae bacterium]|nr:PilN domain-containing protein [Holophagaceae bacterium]
MSLPRLDLNLAPQPTLWRQRHLQLGWGLLAMGLGVLLVVGALTGKAYWEARRAGREAYLFNEEARKSAKREQQLLGQLAAFDVAKESPRWRNAERILQERALPLSRLLAEVEQCLPDGVRLKGIQRSRGRDRVQMKLKAEAKSREAEVAFIEALKHAPVFTQVALERESERQGSGWDFELTLAATGTPAPFKAQPQPLVKAAAAEPSPLKPALARSAPMPTRAAPRRKP